MVEFIGSLYREEQILLLARAWEQANDFAGRWPDMSKLAEPGAGTGGGG
jgi:hypothetical protein